jgi:hypothetical protein
VAESGFGVPAGAGRPPAGSRDVADDAPYCEMPISDAAVGGPLLAQSPLYQSPRPPVGLGDAQGRSYAGALQPPIGLSGGTYALNTEVDAGSPGEKPDTALPGLRDGAYQFSARLKNVGDQGVIDNLLRRGGSYLEVKQAPYVGDDRPAGR